MSILNLYYRALSYSSEESFYESQDSMKAVHGIVVLSIIWLTSPSTCVRSYTDVSSFVEISIGISCSCTPSFVAMLRHHFPRRKKMQRRVYTPFRPSTRLGNCPTERAFVAPLDDRNGSHIESVAIVAKQAVDSPPQSQSFEISFLGALPKPKHESIQDCMA